jgi:hypothetical protein
LMACFDRPGEHRDRPAWTWKDMMLMLQASRFVAREKPLLVLIYSLKLTGCGPPWIPDISSSFGNHCEFGRLVWIVWATFWHYGGGASEGNKPTQPAWYVPEASHPVGVSFLVTF